MEIKKVGDPVLLKPCRPVRRLNRQIRDLLDRMAQTMYQAPGIGLAAPQVGVDRRIIVVDIGDGLIELINPEIIKSQGSADGWEGCLSNPGWYGLVPRSQRITVRGRDRRGNETWIDGEGMLARVLQHEIDHLDGIMFMDRATETVTEEELDRRERARKLKVVAMGTPEFAVATLDMLATRHDLALVITQPDRPVGRRRELKSPAVKQWADERGIPVVQPVRPGEPEIVERVREISPDAIVTAAYGRIVPPALLRIPRIGAFNVHASLLPRHRGAAPIARAIMEGDAQTGVTVMWMDEGMDTGDIALQHGEQILPDDTAGTLEIRLTTSNARALEGALALASEGRCPRTPQDGARATYARPLSRADERIDWTKTAVDIDRQVRALSPAPGAFTTTPTGPIKIWAGRWVSGSGQPGCVEVRDGHLTVACGEGLYRVEQLQPAGARRMSAAQYCHGHPDLDGSNWGQPGEGDAL